MAKSQNTGDSDSSCVQAQIEYIIDQLIRLTLVGIVKKHSLPPGTLDLSAFKTSEERTMGGTLYKVTVTSELHQISVKWELQCDAIKSLGLEITKNKYAPDWWLRIFLKEGFFTDNDITINEDRFGIPLITSDEDSSISYNLQSGHHYTLIAYIKYMPSGEIKFRDLKTLALRGPQNTPIEEIAALKNDLRSILNVNNQESEAAAASDDPIISEHMIDEMLKKKLKLTKKIKQSSLSKDEKRDWIEDIDRKIRNYLFPDN